MNKELVIFNNVLSFVKVAIFFDFQNLDNYIPYFPKRVEKVISTCYFSIFQQSRYLINICLLLISELTKLNNSQMQLKTKKNYDTRDIFNVVFFLLLTNIHQFIKKVLFFFFYKKDVNFTILTVRSLRNKRTITI